MLKHLRNYFFTGLFLLIPIAVTFNLLIWAFDQLDAILGNLIFQIFKVHIIGLGLITLLILITLTGVLAHNFLGRKLIEFGDRVFRKIPIINSIYGITKQITDCFTADKNIFRQVVLIEYPRQGIFSPGFLTASAPGEVIQKTGKSLVSVFVPTVPNPTAGFMVYVPQADVIYLDISIEDGFKLIISAGVIKPN